MGSQWAPKPELCLQLGALVGRGDPTITTHLALARDFSGIWFAPPYTRQQNHGKSGDFGVFRKEFLGILSKICMCIINRNTKFDFPVLFVLLLVAATQSHKAQGQQKMLPKHAQTRAARPCRCDQRPRSYDCRTVHRNVWN